MFLTLGPDIPIWASEEPSVCPHFTGGYRALGESCHWRPSPRMFFQFAKAAARRYAGRVDLWSMYNEPNLEHYLYPQLARVGRGKFVDLAAVRYRRLWYEGWKAIAQYDPANRDRVLFGETAAISSPMDTLYAALCLDEKGRPFRGRMRRLHECTRPRRCRSAASPTTRTTASARGSVFTQVVHQGLAAAGLPRAASAGSCGVAERRGRIPRGRSLYMTEFGFQTNPPDRKRGQSLPTHARSINEADRLFFADRRVVGGGAVRALRRAGAADGRTSTTPACDLNDGTPKPAWGAYRLPLVVSSLGRGRVEVWGQVRPAEGPITPSVQVQRGGAWATVAHPADQRRPATSA